MLLLLLYCHCCCSRFSAPMLLLYRLLYRLLPPEAGLAHEV